MKVLHISTFDTGGAGRAAIRLHEALLQQGIESKFLCLRKDTEIQGVYKYEIKSKPGWKKLLNKIGVFKSQETRYLKKLSLQKGTFDSFTLPFTDFDISNHPLVKEAEIINLHWISWFVDYNSLRKLRKPIIWTLHDMNPFQGGFHYSNDKTASNWDLENELEDIKSNILSEIADLSIIVLNKWMLRNSAGSKVFKNRSHTIISNSIEEEIFKPYNKDDSRKYLGLPSDKLIFLFVSESLDNRRKGFDLLINAIQELKNEEMFFCAIGDIMKRDFSGIYYVGKVNDDKTLALLYSAADAFILPSREDNLPNVILESLSCGTPVIATPVGGAPEIIQNGINGYLTEEVSADGLKKAISLFSETRYVFDNKSIRAYALNEFSNKKQAIKYIDVYKTCLSITK